jgi:hypothetical protein
MRKYSYNKELDILVLRVSEVIPINEIIDHYLELSKDVALPRKLRVLIDCRGTRLNVDTDEIDLTHDAVKEASNKYEYIKEAILIDKPFETVIANLFQHYNEDIENYKFSIFSTEEVALRWLV